MKMKLNALMKMKTFVCLFFAIVLLGACKKEEQSTDYTNIVTDGEMEAELTAPPLVPKPIGNRPAMKLKINMEIKE